MLPAPVRSPLRAACAVAAVVGFLAGSPRASADQVTLKLTGTGPDSATVSYRDGSSSGFQSVTAVPGPYTWSVVSSASSLNIPDPVKTFCVELGQSIQVGQQYTFTTITPISSKSGVTGTEADLVTKLYGAHYADAISGSTTQATAFQLALWEVVYDSNSSLQLNADNLQVTNANADAINLAQTWLNGLGGVSGSAFADNFPGSQLVWLSNDCNQDQIVVVPPNGVPAPPGVLLGLIGVGSCLLGRRFRTAAKA